MWPSGGKMVQFLGTFDFTLCLPRWSGSWLRDLALSQRRSEYFWCLSQKPASLQLTYVRDADRPVSQE